MSPFHAYIVNLILVSCFLAPGSGKQCVGTGPCACEFDDGSGTVDLSSAGTDGGPRFQDQSSIVDGFLYNYNPCFPFTMGNCDNVALCQTDSTITEFYTLGTQDTAVWSFDGTNIQIYYSSTTEVFRESFVTAVCDPDAEEPAITVTGEQMPHQYFLEMRSQCACAGGCSASGGGSGGLSGGSVLLIIVFVLMFVYLAGGITYNRYRHQKTGKEMLPNTDFWSALPGLVKGGFEYIFSCVKSKRTKYDQV